MLFRVLEDMKWSTEKLNLCYIALSEEAIKKLGTADNTNMFWLESLGSPLVYFMRELLNV